MFNDGHSTCFSDVSALAAEIVDPKWPYYVPSAKHWSSKDMTNELLYFDYQDPGKITSIRGES